MEVVTRCALTRKSGDAMSFSKRNDSEKRLYKGGELSEGNESTRRVHGEKGISKGKATASRGALNYENFDMKAYSRQRYTMYSADMTSSRFRKPITSGTACFFVSSRGRRVVCVLCECRHPLRVLIANL